VRTWQGWAYLATVIDLASRRVVGWAMADHMEASLVCDAMAAALAVRRPPPGLMFHSDRGSQGSTPPPSRAPTRSQPHHPEPLAPSPMLRQRRFRKLIRQLQTRDDRGPLLGNHRPAALRHLAWIEGWYNLHRRHSSLGGISPARYEQQKIHQPTTKRHNQPVCRTGAIPLRYRPVL
jgi:transposase InsO family protein